MGRIKKYHTNEERIAARKQATAKYYKSNKEEKNKKDLLRYYQHKVKDLLILSSASLQSLNTDISDCIPYPITGSSDFQLTAFSYVNNPTDKLCKISPEHIFINTTGSVGMPYGKTDYQLDISGNIGDSSSYFFNTDTNKIEEGIPPINFCASSSISYDQYVKDSLFKNELLECNRKLEETSSIIPTDLL